MVRWPSNRQNAELGLMNVELQQQIAINDMKTTVTNAWTGLQSAALTMKRPFEVWNLLNWRMTLLNPDFRQEPPILWTIPPQ